MFGIYRYGLAFCVAISHLWSGMIGGPAAYAVWGFYCLSGYLMTLVLNEKYGFSPRGVARFAVNRALRIYPAYYVICAGMLVIFLVAPGTAARFLPHLHLPVSSQGWWHSLLLFPRPGGGELLHGSSALRVELWFYVGMALGLARDWRITTAWFLFSLAFTTRLLLHQIPFPERYTAVSSCSLAFSVGSLVYHARNFLPVIKTPWAAVAAAAIWWLHVWVSQNIPGGPWVLGLYSSLIFSVFAMVTLMRLNPKELAPWMAKLDRFLGDLSYPMYLCHWGVGIVLIGIFRGKSRDNLSIFLMGFTLANLVSYLIYRYCERPFQSLKLTSGSRHAVTAAAGSGTARIDTPAVSTPSSHLAVADRPTEPVHSRAS